MKRLYLAISIVIVAGLAYLFGWSTIFSVKKVTIGLSDNTVVKQVETVLAQPPSAITIGEKLARVDKRVISARLKSLVWVDRVSVSRNFINGEVTISLTSRRPIARFSGSSTTTRFLGENLETFALTSDAIASATSADSFDWKKLPVLNLSHPTRQIVSDVKSFIDEMSGTGLVITRIDASAPGEIVSTITVAQQNVEVRWGSVHELTLKNEY